MKEFIKIVSIERSNSSDESNPDLKVLRNFIVKVMNYLSVKNVYVMYREIVRRF